METVPAIESNGSVDQPISIWIVTAILIFSAILSFGSGFYLQKMLKTEQNVTSQVPSPTPPSSNQPTSARVGGEFDSSLLLPGKHHFNNSLFVIGQKEPHQTLIVTSSIVEQNHDYAESTRVSYFDGKEWTRDQRSQTITSPDFVANDLISSWAVTIDPSRVLKESSVGEVAISNQSLKFETGTLSNEMTVRSLPGYTRFYSVGKGKLIINGESQPAEILYSRVYSQNASEIQFYNDPFGVTTHWLAYWDKDGNFYHVDATQVEQSSPNYQTHAIAIAKKNDGGVYTTFDVDVSTSEENPPLNYNIKLGEPINKTLAFQTKDSLNKYPKSEFAWFMSKASSGSSFGLVEYIHH